MNSSSIELTLIHSDIAYLEDIATIIKQLSVTNQSLLLLESMEIGHKKALNSFLLIDSALRITAHNRYITIEAQTVNGKNLLSLLINQLPSTIQVTDCDDHYQLQFPMNTLIEDEDNRLKNPSLFDLFRIIMALVPNGTRLRYGLFFAGLFSYDLITQFEAIPVLPSTNHCPDLCIYLAETLLVIDHSNQQAYLQSSLFGHIPLEQKRITERQQQLATIINHAINSAPLAINNVDLLKKETTQSVTSNLSDRAYCDIVTNLQQAILQGEIFQVVPSRRFLVKCVSPLDAYLKLKQLNPSPYLFYLQDRVFTLFGASPESCLKYDKASNQVELYPIAGTRPRARINQCINHDLDSRLELELRTDKKELAEHIMLLDLARNDIARISQPGSRQVADLMKIDKYSHVMHLVSKVIGQLRPGLDALHAYQACMNMGTLTGAPKVRAMQLIAATEQQKRGSYGGAVGYFTGYGDFDSCIVIRSAYVEDQCATIQAGAGVVLDSIAQQEADETYHKAQAVIQAILQTNHEHNLHG